MIDKAILDEVLPVPELEALKEEKISELKEEGFVITNFHSGGVFYTLLMVVLRIKIEFTEAPPGHSEQYVPLPRLRRVARPQSG